MSGKSIVIYGNNNTGKTTQAKLLVERMKKEGMRVRYIKYPIYDLAPTGPLINTYLREGNPHGFTPREVQTLYAMNRTHFEPTLRTWLDQGDYVVIEDYVGTGLAWGEVNGVSPEYLTRINGHLLKEDTTLYLAGERFTVAKEDKHVHEANDALIKKAGEVFDRLARERDWIAIDAKGTIEEVHGRVWQVLRDLFLT